MKAAIIAGALLSGLVVIAASSGAAQQAPAPIDAEALFAAKCKMCHEPPVPRAPSREQMRTRTFQDVSDALRTGIMRPMAADLSPPEINALGRLLGGRAAEGSGIAVPPSTAAAAQPAMKAAPANVVSALFGKLRAVTPAILNNPPPGDWLQWGRTYDGQNYSPLNSINRTTVATLAPAWRVTLQGGPSMPNPIVHDGVMFLQTTPDVVLALNAANGELLWRYAYPSTVPSSQKMGLALGGGRVFVSTSDLHVIALDAKTGAKAWDQKIELSAPATNRPDFQLRSAPLIVGNKVIQGVTASGAPGGGYIIGMDIATGRELWRFHTIARPGEPGGNTWNGLPLDRRSGASVWDQGTYDPKLNLVYFGVGQTYDTAGLHRPSGVPGTTQDGLYTDATLALNPDTGRLVWHYQHMSNDQWDLDWVFERQLVTLKVGGRDRRLVMTIGKMGLLDALDAKTGQDLFSVDSGTQNLITAIDPVTGIKTTDPTKYPDPSRPAMVCPHVSGARSWPSTAFSPRTSLVYVPLTEWCMTLAAQGGRLLSAPGAALNNADHPDAVKDGKMGRLQALDVAGRKKGWTVDLDAPLSTSVLATAGGIVFTGDLDPALKAFDEKDGKLLWTARLDNYASSSIITYSVGKTQYVAVVTGLRNNHINDLSRRYATFRRGRSLPVAPNPTGAPAVQVFALPGG